jgi:hypothetical protein
MGHWPPPLMEDLESALAQSDLSEGLLLILFMIGEVGDELSSEVLVVWEPAVPKPIGRAYE